MPEHFQCMLVLIRGERRSGCSEILVSVIKILKEGKSQVPDSGKTFRLANKPCEENPRPYDGCDKDNGRIRSVGGANASLYGAVGANESTKSETQLSSLLCTRVLCWNSIFSELCTQFVLKDCKRPEISCFISSLNSPLPSLRSC